MHTELVSSTLESAIRWNAEGLVPAIVQDVASREVLMMAWMNAEALRKTLDLGQTHFYSRSRKSLWHKGGSSGHVQTVASIRIDCDGDVLLIAVRQDGGACHEGYRTCFFREADGSGQLRVAETRVFDPATVYPGSAENTVG